jgi:hypothetical protein
MDVAGSMVGVVHRDPDAVDDSRASAWLVIYDLSGEIAQHIAHGRAAAVCPASLEVRVEGSF